MSLVVKNLSYKASKKTLLNDVSFEANDGDMIGIIGPNGAGKSTLLKHIAAILPLKPLCVELDGCDFSTLLPRELAKKVVYLAQFTQIPQISVLETLELSRRAYSGAHLSSEDAKKIEACVQEFALEDILEQNLQLLSGGERQKVLIAAALLQEPKMLLLDEPISHLDPKNQLEMLYAIRKATYDKKLITLIVLHDIQHSIHYANRQIMVKNGNLLYDVPTTTLKSHMLEELFDMKISLNVAQGHTFVYYGHSHKGLEDDHHLETT